MISSASTRRPIITLHPLRPLILTVVMRMVIVMMMMMVVVILEFHLKLSKVSQSVERPLVIEQSR